MTHNDAVYRPGDPAEIAALLPVVEAAAASLDISLDAYDVPAVAAHLAGLLRQHRLVQSVIGSEPGTLAPVFEP